MNKSKKKKKILLVTGFDSIGNTKIFLNIYINFKLFFKESDYNLDTFYYKNSEDIITVYKRLEKHIKKKNYNIILAHSMGGALVFNYCYHNDINNFHKIIFIAPYIFNIPFYKLLLNKPFISKLSLPRVLYPTRILFENNNLFDIGFNLIPLKQIYETNKYLFKDETKVIDILNKSKNIHLIYMDNDTITPINKDILNKIKNKNIIRGSHEVFHESSNLYNFFCLIKKLL